MRPTLSASFISGIATPHVNAILSALAVRPEVRLNLYYAAETLPGYPEWKRNPTHLVQRANLYGDGRPSAKLLRRLVFTGRGRRERLIVVGWANPTTRLLLALLALTRRPFIFFSDEPREEGARGRARGLLREGYFGILRHRAIVLATGRNAVSYFRAKGIPEGRVLNAPIPTTIPANLAELKASRNSIRARFGVSADGLFAVTGSRLVHAKGFDVLVRAVGEIDAPTRAKLRVLIVGSGPEQNALEDLIRQAGLSDIVQLAPWMEVEDFEAVLAGADLALHPSRFDGYGAISLMAVGLGLPVVGSRTAGSAAELIEHGHNGFLYDPEDAAALAAHLRTFLAQPSLLAAMGRRSAELAPRWSPDRVADVFVQALSMLE